MITKRIAGGAALLVSLAAPLHRLQALAAHGHTTPTPPLGAGAAETGSARGAYFAGLRARGTEQRRLRFAEGIAAARARLANDPDDPEGLLWLAANLGAEALERGRLMALPVLPEMERLLLRLDAIAPTYDNAAAARTLGRLYHKAPAIISIGSMKKARHWWQKALALAADHPANLALAADFHHADGDHDRARQLATRYLAAPVWPDQHPDAGQWRELAEKIVRQR
jgi:hypothetical protein